MKIGLSLSILAGVLGLASCSPKVSKTAIQTTQLSSYQDSLSYAFGAVNGAMYEQVIKSFPKDTLDKNAILKGFNDLFLGNPSPFTRQTAETFVTKHLRALEETEQKAYVSRNDSALLINRTREGVISTESGLQYRVLRAGKGDHPKATDTVEVHYVGRLIDGKEFDSSYKRNESVKFPLNQVIKGWTEGVQLMNKGAKYEFYIPSSLAYGERGAGKDIPPHSTLIFEVELLDILPYQQVSESEGQTKTTKAEAPKKSKRKNKK